MSKQATTKGGKRGRKIGRASRKPKTARYKNHKQRERNKIKRILQSNGAKWAELYASQFGLEYYYKRLVGAV